MAIRLNSADAWGGAGTPKLSAAKAEAAPQVSDLALRMELALAYVGLVEPPLHTSGRCDGITF